MRDIPSSFARFSPVEYLADPGNMIQKVVMRDLIITRKIHSEGQEKIVDFLTYCLEQREVCMCSLHCKVNIRSGFMSSHSPGTINYDFFHLMVLGKD